MFPQAALFIATPHPAQLFVATSRQTEAWVSQQMIQGLLPLSRLTRALSLRPGPSSC